MSKKYWELPNREVLAVPNYPPRNNFVIPDAIMQHQPCLGKYSGPLIDSVKLKQRFYTIAYAAESLYQRVYNHIMYSLLILDIVMFAVTQCQWKGNCGYNES